MRRFEPSLGAGSGYGAEMPAEPSTRTTFEDARRVAQISGWREKVLIYLTRGDDELLVLEHTDQFPHAGVQVPAGGVDPGEDPATTAHRELFEETGLQLTDQAIYLASHVLTRAAPSRVRHYYWMTAPPATPGSWSHVVSAGDEDAGMLFLLTFRPLHNPGLTPHYGWESALGRLSTAMQTGQ